MMSIHVALGMHCVDCHFDQDAHGNGYLQGEVANAIEIRCADCHGTPDAYPTLRTSGPAAPPGGRDLSKLRTQDGRLRFEWKGSECDWPVTEQRDCKPLQRSALYPDVVWEMHTVKDSIDPTSPIYNPMAARAKLMSKRADQA